MATIKDDPWETGSMPWAAYGALGLTNLVGNPMDFTSRNTNTSSVSSSWNSKSGWTSNSPYTETGVDVDNVDILKMTTILKQLREIEPDSGKLYNLVIELSHKLQRDYIERTIQ